MAKIIKYIIVCFSLIFVSLQIKAQDVMVTVDNVVSAYIEDGDTIPQLLLPPVYVFPILHFKSKQQEKFYWRTVRDVKRTLPYAKAIGRTLAEINAELEKIPDEKGKKAYMKSKEDDLIGKYEPQLKKLTLSQGKMLIRLVDRECEQTSYELIKQYRGGFRAFFWQGFARLLGADLKANYDKDDEDKIVERVIILVEAGQL
ncbi:MAG TPA: DUF4294 domain-containing protein [Paludibacteraceae bacterium]|jgi:hypothetical protein|nr:DUF4294 domain-containing protein [Paludibacteraceae bacterium]HPH62072.1 DUF4294 domain-containing protein [Paludibacteraceae bacterium]